MKDAPTTVYVVCHRKPGQANRGICFTDDFKPAVFAHAEDAELLAAKRRGQFEDILFAVIDARIL